MLQLILSLLILQFLNIINCKIEIIEDKTISKI